jgi:pantetheine-phosphate adenylyltransferase
MERKVAVYAGSFDPPTLGHLWVIRQAAMIFDQLVVAIGVNAQKRSRFSVDERMEMLRESVSHLSNVDVAFFPNVFLVHFAESIGAKYIVRGLRNSADFASELVMRNFNADQNPEITEWFVITPRELAEVSSSFVMGLVGNERWEEVVKPYLPHSVFSRVKEQFDAKSMS